MTPMLKSQGSGRQVFSVALEVLPNVLPKMHLPAFFHVFHTFPSRFLGNSLDATCLIFVLHTLVSK